jgi:hypothetical protein
MRNATLLAWLFGIVGFVVEMVSKNETLRWSNGKPELKEAV